MIKNQYISSLCRANSRWMLPMLIVLLLTACTNDAYLGGETQNGTAMAFSGHAGMTTRAGLSGAEAAALLGNEFVVYGQKLIGTESQSVFPGYKVNYTPNTANTTESNTADWEYLGLTSPTEGVGIQTIKYWDHAANSYTFAAYSLGKGDEATTPTTKAAVTVDSSNQLLSNINLQGTVSQLTACYFTNKQKVESDGYRHPVQLQFRNLAANIRLGLYETISGYSVKDVKFYKNDDDNDDDDVAKMYASTAAIPSAAGGTYTITYNEDGKAQLAFTAAEPVSPATTSLTNLLSLGGLQATTFADKQESETDEKVYLARTSNASTITIYNKVLPVSSGTDLHLKVDYTLLSLDGSGQTTHVKGATAVVPAAYANWKSSNAYTYIFKISDNTNGHTGSTTDPTGLYPITFDAWSKTNEDGQGTITTFGDYSITTYQEGSVDGESVGYSTNKDINVTVIKGDGSEATKVALCDKSQNKDWLRIVLQSSSNESDVEQDYPTGKEVTGITYADGIATFKPTEEGFYRVEYWHKEEGSEAQKLSVKIVKVGSPKGDGSIKAILDEWDNDYRKAPPQGGN